MLTTNATVAVMAIMYRDSDGAKVQFSTAIRVYARILREDIEVTEVLYRKVWYTANTNDVLFDHD